MELRDLHPHEEGTLGPPEVKSTDRTRVTAPADPLQRSEFAKRRRRPALTKIKEIKAIKTPPLNPPPINHLSYGTRGTSDLRRGGESVVDEVRNPRRTRGFPPLPGHGGRHYSESMEQPRSKDHARPSGAGSTGTRGRPCHHEPCTLAPRMAAYRRVHN